MAGIPDFSLDLVEFFIPTDEQAQPQKTRFSVVNEEALEDPREKNHIKKHYKWYENLAESV